MKSNFKITEDYGLLLMMAFRYALGRKTYVVQFIVGEILDNWDNFSKERQEQFKKEILEHAELYGNLGHDMDEREWYKILKKC